MATVSQLEALAVLAQLVLLAAAITIGHSLRRKRVLWIGGAGAALLLGVLVGVLIRLARTAPLVDSWMVFQSEFFFLVLLPPIMFEACFNLDSRLFVKNIGSVCTLAFAGTTISTFAVGLTMWAAGQLGLCFRLSFLEALTFGALISATDPVTVLAIFQALGADPDLYMNVFGESVLNDAVAMVLFQACSGFASREVPVTAANIAKAAFSFWGIFLGSIVLGVLMGLAAAALLRSRWYHGEVNLETALMLLLGYASYMAGAAAGLSGIVSVVFCAMVCGAYCAPNLSPGGLQASRGVYAVLSSCMETFVFVYIGVTLFMEPQQWHCVKFTIVCLAALAWSRAANVLPCCAAINWVRPPQLAISGRQQLVLWWSGLRGAMAFALAVEAAQLFGEAGKVMKTCTFIVILVTVLINGGSTAYLLDWCGLAQGAGLQQAAVSDAAASTGDGQQQGDIAAGQQLLQQQGESECEQVQLLLHEKLRGKLQERGRTTAVGQAAAVAIEQADDYKMAASIEKVEQPHCKQHVQQLGRKPVLVWDAFAEGMSEDRAHQPVMNGAASAAVAAAYAARIASPATLLQEGDATAGTAAVHRHGNLRRCSSNNGSVPAPATDAVVQQAYSFGLGHQAADSSTPAFLHRLRANGDHLQDQLDRLDAAVFRRWFVNAESAREHEQSGPQQAQRH